MVWVEILLFSKFLTLASAPLPPYLDAYKGVEKILPGVECLFLPETIPKGNFPIIAIGSDALKQVYTLNRTIIFTMVLYPDVFLEDTNVYGVRFEPNPEDVIEKVRALNFEIKRVHILTTKYSKQYGVRLKYAFEQRLKSPCNLLNGIQSILKGLKTLKKGDIVVIPPDPLLYTKETLIMITPVYFQKGVPVIGFSEKILKYGISLSITPDYKDEGEIAARIAKRLKNKENIKKRFYYPKKIKVHTNDRLIKLLRQRG